MPDKKKHHYVPQFYLRYFAHPCNKNISIFNIPSGKYISHGPIKFQAYNDYLYGKDGVLENSLGYIEERFKQLIDSIINYNGRVFFHDILYKNVLLYIVVQLNRTLMVKDIYEKQYSEMMRITLEMHPDFKNIKLNELNLNFDGVLQNCIYESAKMVTCIYDLGYKILINNSEDEFITSDNPVVKYNMFMESFKLPPGGTGLISKGLQIFYPITKKYMLYFYDKNVYKTGSLFKKYFAINNKSTVKLLNALQYLNCRDNLYFSNNVTEYYIRRLVNRYQKYRINDFNPVDEYIRKDTTDKPDRLVHFHERILRINLQLSFIKFKLLTYLKRYKKTLAIPRTKKLKKYLNELDKKMEDKNPTTAST